MRSKTLILRFMGLFFLSSYAQSQVSVIPQPSFFKSFGGAFAISSNTFIQTPPDFFEANYLVEQMDKLYGVKVKSANVSEKAESVIEFNINKSDSTHVNEWYNLIVSKKAIRINAKTSTGIFYGIQSLLQLARMDKKGNVEIPYVEIRDEPRYEWRGMHLDVCRHFFTKEEIKKYLDYLALYKFNVFHWHLTEDQGWRIEIKKYPKLSEIGAWRKGSQVGAYKQNQFDTLRYGGFYTQQDIKEIVIYASERHITVVPEIEMPRHSLTALAA